MVDKFYPAGLAFMGGFLLALNLSGKFPNPHWTGDWFTIVLSALMVLMGFYIAATEKGK